MIYNRYIDKNIHFIRILSMKYTIVDKSSFFSLKKDILIKFRKEDEILRINIKLKKIYILGGQKKK